MHPDARCFEETRFYVPGNEGSILISCASSLALSLIKPHEKLDHLPPKGNKNIIQQTKLKTYAEKITDGCSKKEQSNNITCTRNIETRNVNLKKVLLCGQ